MSWHTRRDFRKIHRWGALLIALPFLIVLITGLFLQVKKEFSWIQPPSQKGSISYQTPEVGFDRILEISKSDSEANISSWEDVDRLDVRPDDGVVKVRSVEGWELQIDLGTGAILSSMMRRSDIIESIHDGSWFHDQAKLWIFLPSAIVVTILWITGIYLFFLPYFAKWQNRKRMKNRKQRRRKRKKVHEDLLEEVG
ncbi:MAG TPA: PepSY-associated TM helix domain-containing protein [Halalkalibaculum sp.]|nr:PepSY-associated TM helix domain-containing protein [Halalkalibaculum sp.]